MPKTPRTRSVLSRIGEQNHLEDHWDEPAPSARPARPAVAEALHGAWQSIEGQRQADLIIAGDRLTIHFEDGDIYMGRFTVSANGRPRKMDVVVEEGPAQHRGLVALGIFEIDGEQLRWCTASPGQADRPAAFTQEHPRHLCMVFRRRPTPKKG
jgi:uncharacterized protein (TIGR03067 family)